MPAGIYVFGTESWPTMKAIDERRLPQQCASVAVEAPAKVNLLLEVIGRRSDGYHELSSVVQALDLSDLVVLTPLGEGEAMLEVEGRFSLPTGERNLTMKALRAMERHVGHSLPVEIILRKRIPVAAGLGGGSSDAAAVMEGLNRLFRLGITREGLMDLAASVGSDVPFFFSGGGAIIRGRGEVVTPLASLGRRHVLLCVPSVAVSTAEVYAALPPECHRLPSDSLPLVTALRNDDIEGAGRFFFNSLESVVLDRYPQVRALKDLLAAAGGQGCLMSGSGSAVFCLARGEDEARTLAGAVREAAREIIITRFRPDGLRVVD